MGNAGDFRDAQHLIDQYGVDTVTRTHQLSRPSKGITFGVALGDLDGKVVVLTVAGHAATAGPNCQSREVDPAGWHKLPESRSAPRRSGWHELPESRSGPRRSGWHELPESRSEPRRSGWHELPESRSGHRRIGWHELPEPSAAAGTNCQSREMSPAAAAGTNC